MTALMTKLTLALSVLLITMHPWVWLAWAICLAGLGLSLLRDLARF